MRIATIILPASDHDAPVHWLRVVDGSIVQHGTDANWFQPDEGEDNVALLVLPPHQSTLHWMACPDMTPRQGAAAARLMALDASIGSGALHAAVLPSASADAPHIVAVTSESAMTHWLGWCAEHGVADAAFVPAALLLPEPETGYVSGRIGPNLVVRGGETAFDGDEPTASLIMGDAPVATLSEPEIVAALLAALADPPLDLRQGAFAPAVPRAFDAARLTRLAALVGIILLAGLLVSLVQIVRLNLEASRLDAQAVELARTIDPAIADAADAQVKLNARRAERDGNGFTGIMAGMMSAMRATPGVSLASVNQSADGALRVRLAARNADEINDVLIALQDAGWRIAANAVQQQGGKVVADIMVVR